MPINELLIILFIIEIDLSHVSKPKRDYRVPLRIILLLNRVFYLSFHLRREFFSDFVLYDNLMRLWKHDFWTSFANDSDHIDFCWMRSY